MQFVFPLAMLFVWLFPVAMTVRGVVLEKESRLKEYIKMVGVSDTQLNLSKIIVSGDLNDLSFMVRPHKLYNLTCKLYCFSSI